MGWYDKKIARAAAHRKAGRRPRSCRVGRHGVVALTGGRDVATSRSAGWPDLKPSTLNLHSKLPTSITRSLNAAVFGSAAVFGGCRGVGFGQFFSGRCFWRRCCFRQLSRCGWCGLATMSFSLLFWRGRCCTHSDRHACMYHARKHIHTDTLHGQAGEGLGLPGRETIRPS